MQALLSLVLALPLLATSLYSMDSATMWLALSLLALGLAITAIHSFLSLVSIRYLRQLVALALCEVLAVFQLSRLLSFYFQGESFNERFFFHFNLNTVQEAGSAYPELLSLALGYLIITGLLALRVYRTRPVLLLRRPAMTLGLCMLGILITEPDALRLSRSSVASISARGESLSLETINWSETGLDPAALRANLNNVLPGKNLVLIYLESLEQIYTEESIFPGLTPNLNRMLDHGLVFSDMTQTEGTDWTVGGMVSSQCGTPVLYSFGPGGNDILQGGYLINAVCLGDVLHQAGYQQVFMGGASTEFAGKGSFLAAHGYDEILGRAQLRGKLVDSDYLSGWGLYDDNLFELAEDKFRELAQNDRPFNLTLLTLDTHHPTGNPSRSCQPYAGTDNSMLDAVHCSDALLARFLEALQQHPAWNETVVVLLSDHLAMRNAAQLLYPEGYERKLLFAVINGDKLGEIDVRGTHMDVAPTVLDLLQVKHRQAFLAGTSLVPESSTTHEAVPPESPSRLEAIRYLNSSVLSRQKTGLCESEALVSIEGGRLRIAGREVVLSISGDPLPLEALSSDYAQLNLIDTEGDVRANLTLNVRNLPHVLYQYQSAASLLLAPSAETGAFTTGAWQSRPVSVILGSLNGESHDLGAMDTSEGAKVDASDCEAVLAKVRDSLAVAPSSSPAEICSPDDAVPSYFASESGNLVLPQVATEKYWYSAMLVPNKEGNYSVLDLAYQGPIQDQNWAGRCHAYFGNSELIVPRIRSGQSLESLHLRLIPGRDWEFEVLLRQ